MTLPLIAFATFVSTLLGGIFALRFRDKLHLILGFSAGAVVGVALFDLLPEAVELALPYRHVDATVGLVALGFAAYMVLDRALAIHGHAGEHCRHHGDVGAGTLSLHSFVDGLGIGLAFQASAALGWAVAVAVLAHDFSDGINTVNMVLKNNGPKKQAIRWLLMDAAAPVLAIALTMFIHVSLAQLAGLLALFAGFFLYIGASDLIPESHHAHPKVWTTVATLLGMGAIYMVVQMAG